MNTPLAGKPSRRMRFGILLSTFLLFAVSCSSDPETVDGAAIDTLPEISERPDASITSEAEPEVVQPPNGNDTPSAIGNFVEVVPNVDCKAASTVTRSVLELEVASLEDPLQPENDIDEPLGAVPDDFWATTPPRIAEVNGSVWSRAGNDAIAIIGQNGDARKVPVEKTRWESIWPATDGVWLVSPKKVANIRSDETAIYFDLSHPVDALGTRNGNLLFRMRRTDLDNPEPLTPEQLPTIHHRSDATITPVVGCDDVLTFTGNRSTDELHIVAILTPEGVSSAAGTFGQTSTIVEGSDVWVIDNVGNRFPRPTATIHHFKLGDDSVDHIASFELPGQVLPSSQISAIGNRTLVASQTFRPNPQRLYLWEIDPGRSQIERFEARRSNPRAVRWYGEIGYAVNHTGEVEIVDFGQTEPTATSNAPLQRFGGRSYQVDDNTVAIVGEQFNTLRETTGITVSLWDFTDPTGPEFLNALTRSGVWPATTSNGYPVVVRWLDELQQLAIPIGTIEVPNQMWIVQVDGEDLTEVAQLQQADRKGRNTQRSGIDNIIVVNNQWWTASVFAVQPNDTNGLGTPIFVRDLE